MSWKILLGTHPQAFISSIVSRFEREFKSKRSSTTILYPLGLLPSSYSTPATSLWRQLTANHSCERDKKKRSTSSLRERVPTSYDVHAKCRSSSVVALDVILFDAALCYFCEELDVPLVWTFWSSSTWHWKDDTTATKVHSYHIIHLCTRDEASRSISPHFIQLQQW